MKNRVVTLTDTISRSKTQVFDAVANHQKLSCFFVSSASEDLTENKIIERDIDDVQVTLKIKVLSLIENEEVVLNWSASGRATKVSIKVNEIDLGKTAIAITEGEWCNDDLGIRAAMQPTQG